MVIAVTLRYGLGRQRSAANTGGMRFGGPVFRPPTSFPGPLSPASLPGLYEESDSDSSSRSTRRSSFPVGE